MHHISISYRRDDNSGHAGRLHGALRPRFGAESAFIDIETIGAGADFAEAIDTAMPQTLPAVP